MALDPDPYRTLGLKRGATLDEVKRAYRRLAKINHPDAAGEAALPRFLAIQAAYEQLAGPAAPGSGRRPTAAPRRPWDAEAEATRRAYGGRARNAPPGGGGGGAGATGKGGPAGSGGSAGEQSGPGGADGGSGGWTRRSGATGRGGAASGRPGRRRTYEPRPDPGTSGTPPGGTTREPNKATLGSTSYDGADVGPFEPDWGGANWYGTTSGTYWTVNPKEYADPRKHGPEYQARARRAARARGADPSGAPDAGANPGAPGDEAEQTDGDRPADPTHTTSSWWDSTAGPEGPDDASGAAADPFATPPDSASPGARYDRTQNDTRPEPRAGERPPPDLGRAAADIGHALTDDRFGGSRGRLARALIGWLPIALGLSWLVGEMTGCGRFAATCDDGVAGPLLFVLQILAFAVLLVIPAAASIATMAALTLLAAAVVASLVLSATGAAADGDSRRAALGLVLLIAWLAGLAIGVGRRVGLFRSGASPVS
jgi:DnaJ domain